ncbi:RNB domain-containing ribonuclease [Candidatus Peregrinibacteria bacterium]|nr:RNB domain-containing ribonuclease [Candidatus Peregrinibacteria bacterium]MBT4056338.1 RNB domain-containing ribonuclease [Candidatus Peregrinibacteria bacterium]
MSIYVPHSAEIEDCPLNPRERKFPDAVIQEAAQTELSDEIFEGRERVRGITIDSPATQDIDDAIWLERVHGQGLKLQVSIADVAAMVPIGSAMDEEAIRRVQSYYYSFDEFVSPMLPTNISENLASLHQGEKRPTITFEVWLSHRGNVKGLKIKRTYIENEARYSFYGANCHIINQRPNQDLRMLTEMSRLAEHLFKQRAKRGSVVDQDAYKMTEFRSNIRTTPSYIMIQEFMILVNTEVAKLLRGMDAPNLYRNCNNATEAASSAEIAQISDQLRGRAEASTGDEDIFIERATYGPVSEGHSLLALPEYSHVTSPIRRYPDLVVQRMLKTLVEQEESPYTQEDLARISGYINERTLAVIESRPGRKKNKRKFTQRERQEGRLKYLEKNSFKKAVAYACKHNLLKEDFKEEIIKRIREDQIGPIEAYYILIIAKNTDTGWRELKTLALEWVSQKQGRAKNTLSQICTVSGQTVKVQYHDEGTKTQPQIRAFIYVNGEKPLRIREASNEEDPQKAKADAALYALQELSTKNPLPLELIGKNM